MHTRTSTYQAKLRADRALCSGIRFDVKWDKNMSGNVKLQLELRVTGDAKPIIRELAVKPSRRGGWDAITLDGDAFRAMGKIIAWRVLLLHGDIELAECRSFLWIESKPSRDASGSYVPRGDVATETVPKVSVL